MTDTLYSKSESVAAKVFSADPELRSVLSGDYFQILSKRLLRVEIDGESLYVAEGDTLLDEDQLILYAQRRKATEKLFKSEQAARSGGLGIVQLVTSGSRVTSPSILSSGLLGIVQQGRIVRWSPGKILTYCVLKNTFTDEANYNIVVENMLKATGDWESTCGVKFAHQSELDASPTTSPNGVLFAVRFINAGGAFIASAFFPNDPINRRKVLIDPSYFSTSFDQVGVLRHELGHVLGFRHEHIRSGAPPVCSDEDTTGTIDLTLYDPKSVMHYFCGGVGSRDLSISALDADGAQKLYGPPLQGFDFVS